MKRYGFFALPMALLLCCTAMTGCGSKNDDAMDGTGTTVTEARTEERKAETDQEESGENDAAGDMVTDVEDGARDLMTDAGDAVQDAGDAAGDVVQDAGDAVDDLMGGDDTDSRREDSDRGDSGR